MAPTRARVAAARSSEHSLGMRGSLALLLTCALLSGCSGGSNEIPAEGEVVIPPFDVRGEADGLFLVWFDEDGPHTASRRSEVPEAHRATVRVDDLNLRPEDHLSADLVYVADLGEAGPDGRYVVRRMPRESFERQVAEASEPEAPEVAADTGDGQVVLYGASWCGACRQARAFLRERQVPFVDRDIERDQGARDAMNAAAQAAGVPTTGIPIIDFRGDVIAGFDQPRLSRLIEQSRSSI